jgi:hypothetical protein
MTFLVEDRCGSRPCARSSANIALMASLLLLNAVQLFGQTTQGAILGNITDPTGSVVPSVAIEVKNQDTGFTRNTRTDTQGFYLVDHLEPGRYSVEASAAGFKKILRLGTTLATNQQARVDLALEVAQTNELITVTGASPVIETESARISTVFDRNMATFNALDGRTTFDLLLASPSAFWSGDGYAVQGTRAAHTGFSLDGVSFTNEQGGDMQTAYFMDNEDTQEFRVNSVNNPAEYKYSAIVEQTSRGGTNALHGEANFEHNDSALNAKSFFASSKAVTRNNQFYGAISGPVYIPKLYNGHNKTFFYFHYEELLSPGAVNTLANVPTDAMRTGDFSALPTPIIDPSTGAPFPGNVIPASRINSSAQKYLQRFYPQANFGSPLIPSQNFNFNYTQNVKEPTYAGRIDHRVNDKFTFYGRFLFNDQTVRQEDDGLPTQYLGKFRNDQTSGDYMLAATYVFSPTIVNEARIAYARMFGIYQNFLDGRSVVDQIGLTGYPQAITPDAFGVPQVQVAGLLSIATTNYGRPVDHHWDMYDNITITHGSHAFKTGVNFLNAWVSRFPSSPSAQLGAFNFSGFATGLGFSDYLLGIPQTSSWSAELSPYYGRRWYIGGYFQDDWKIHKNLTLNLGIRYEYGNPFSEQSNRIFNFDPATGSLVVPNQQTIGMVSSVFPANIPIITASQAGVPASTLIRSDKKNFAPRVGFAYRSPFWGLVMRGGYGIYYSLEYQRAFGDMTGGPFVGTQTYDNTIKNGTPLWTWPSIVPAGVAPNSLGIQDVGGVSPNLPSSYMQQWSMSLEKQFGQNGLRVSYIGEESVHLPYSRNLNQPFPSTTPFSQDLRPYPIYRDITYVDTGGNQSYNSLQVEFTRHLHSGLMISSHYSWTKNITDAHDITALGDTIENAYCLECERGNEEFTPRHRWLTQIAYELPFGKGRPFLHNSNPVVQGVLGGWTTANYIIFSTGSWETPLFTGADISNTNNTSGRPDRVCNGNLSNPNFPSLGFDVSCFVRPGAGIGRFGDSGIGIIQGPSQNGWSTNIFKYFFLGEKAKMRVQANFQNALNHPIFGWVIKAYGGDSGLDIESSSAGSLCCQINTQAGDFPSNRTIVVGAKLEF